MNEWIDNNLPWLPWVFVAIGILAIIAGCIWSSLVNYWNELSLVWHHWYLFLLIIIPVLLIVIWSIIRTKNKVEQKTPVAEKATNNLSIRVGELTISDNDKEVRVTLVVNNRSLNDVLVDSFDGIASLDAHVTSRVLYLEDKFSQACFDGQDDTNITFRFNIQSDKLNELRQKNKDQNDAYWRFDLRWGLKYPSEERIEWVPNDIVFSGVPRIGGKGDTLNVTP